MWSFSYVDYTSALNPIVYAIHNRCNILGYNKAAPRKELEFASGYSFPSELPDKIFIQTGTELWRYQSQMSFWYNSTEYNPQTDAFNDLEYWTEVGTASYEPLEYCGFEVRFVVGVEWLGLVGTCVDILKSMIFGFGEVVIYHLTGLDPGARHCCESFGSGAIHR